MTFHYWSKSALVTNIFNVIIDLRLTPVFNWMKWEEGKAILKDMTSDYLILDSITLCKLLTVIIRADRFNEGYMISCFDNGIMTSIIKGLQLNLENRHQCV